MSLEIFQGALEKPMMELNLSEIRRYHINLMVSACYRAFAKNNFPFHYKIKRIQEEHHEGFYVDFMVQGDLKSIKQHWNNIKLHHILREADKAQVEQSPQGVHIRLYYYR